MEKTKVCFKCGVDKPLSMFYKHPKMGDGHLGKCKECAKNDVRLKYDENVENPLYVEKERARGRDKWKRLHHNWNIKNKHSEGKDTSRFLKNKGIDMEGKEAHHWNYNLQNDVFIMPKRAHRLIHKYLLYDENTKMFFDSRAMNLIESMPSHLLFIKDIFELNGKDYEILIYIDNT